MIFRNRQKDPRAMIRIGMIGLLLFNLWPRLIPVTFGLGPDWIDAIRGFMLGASACVILWALRLKVRGGRTQGNGRCG